MKIPNGMTENEVVQIISKVVERQASKFRFGYYESEDMKQEAFIIAMDALERYDNKRPLENFLAVHVNNRLKNFKRDHFYRLDNEKHEAKRNIMDPIDLSSIKDEFESGMRTEDDFVDFVEQKEIVNLIDLHLNITFREDYLKILHGVYVPKPRREQIYKEIQKILREPQDEEG